MSSEDEARRLVAATMELGRQQELCRQARVGVRAVADRAGELQVRASQNDSVEMTEASVIFLRAYARSAKAFTWSLESALDQLQAYLDEADQLRRDNTGGED